MNSNDDRTDDANRPVSENGVTLNDDAVVTIKSVQHHAERPAGRDSLAIGVTLFLFITFTFAFNFSIFRYNSIAWTLIGAAYAIALYTVITGLNSLSTDRRLTKQIEFLSARMEEARNEALVADAKQLVREICAVHNDPKLTQILTIPSLRDVKDFINPSPAFFIGTRLHQLDDLYALAVDSVDPEAADRIDSCRRHALDLLQSSDTEK